MVPITTNGIANLLPVVARERQSPSQPSQELARQRSSGKQKEVLAYRRLEMVSDVSLGASGKWDSMYGRGAPMQQSPQPHDILTEFWVDESGAVTQRRVG